MSRRDVKKPVVFSQTKIEFNCFYYILLSPMKKNFIVLSLIVSFLMVVIHEMIPHHHHEMEDDIELFSHQHSTDKQSSNSETEPTNHFPIPAHHHVSVTEGFDLVRVSTNLEREITSPFCFLVPDHLLRIPDPEPPGSKFYSDFRVPKNSLPFIISPNAMRGSPSVA